MELIVISNTITPDKIIKEMNKSFKNQDQFEQQLDSICLDIALKFNMEYDRQKNQVCDFIEFKDKDI